MAFSLLVVSDDFSFRQSVRQALSGEFLRWTVEEIPCGEAVQRTEQLSPDLALLDADSLSPARAAAWTPDGRALRKPQVLIASAKRDFDMVREAMRRGAADYLLKPLDGAELHQALERAARQMTLAQSQAAEAHHYVRNQLMQDIHHALFIPDSLPLINRKYRTTFAPGCFQAALFKLDGDIFHMQQIYENESYYQLLTGKLLAALTPLCFDIIFDKLSDSTLAFLNYAEENKHAVRQTLEAIYREVKREICTSPGIRLTLCVSREHTDATHLPEAKNEVLDARWQRLELGGDQVIGPEKEEAGSSYSPAQVRQMFHLGEQIEHAFERIDFERARRDLEQFFRLPPSLLATRDGRMLTKSCIDSLFNVYFRIVSSGQEAHDLRHRFIYLVNMSSTFDHVCQVFCQEAEKVMQVISRQLTSVYSTHVYEAIMSINRQVRKPVTLNDLAAEIGLNASYLSSLFRRETGKCITQYVAETKMDLAKRMLSGNLMNVTEIADYLGYTDVRYFSRTFHKVTGLSPSEYKAVANHRA
ncbi:MAG: helix-turn-helix domain-containing protein [Aristaeellaceae bacterium]